MPKKNITTEDLSRMIAKGFAETATKKDLGSLKIEVNELKTEMNDRFDKIERLILADHKRRIERLELEMRELKNALAM